MSAPPLSPALLLAAYAQGYFPMGDEAGEVGWYDPDPRAIFPLEGLKVPRSLDKVARSGRYRCTLDQDFEGVVRACAHRPSTWITPAFVEAYGALHRLGHAHSVEVWEGDRQVAGLYGVSLGAAFMGESMHGPADPMKVGLLALVGRLREQGYLLLDSQLPTEHWLRHGQQLIPRALYKAKLAEALQRPCRLNPSGRPELQLQAYWRSPRPGPSLAQERADGQA